MKTLLIFPAQWYPTQPYLSTPYLTAYLRAKGWEVEQRDFNIASYDHFLSAPLLQNAEKLMARRMESLKSQNSLSMKEQTEQVLAKIDGFLAEAGTDKTRILSATVYLAAISGKDEMNEAWMAWLDKSHLPARAAVGVELVPGTLVEIMVCATR